jgi:GNAT superfamily N-acetyltransferase
VPRADILRSVPVTRSARVMQLEGMFEVPPTQKSEERWSVNLPLDEKPWNVGLIVGPSGCGKTTIAREMFDAAMVSGYEWPDDRSIVDAFPERMSIKDVTAILSSVGFSSPPSWLRPFRVLSNGEQFRVTIARAIAEGADLTVVDEFTSVVDRTVAKIGSAAIAKTIRKRGLQFIGVACHYDIIEWLQPDWMYEPATDIFSWRSVQPRPRIELEICRVHREAWKIFKHHHYLDTNLHQATACFVGMVEGRPAAFTGVLAFPHAKRPGWREHRTVCLPDFQGVGIGNAISEFVAGVYRTKGRPYFSTTSSPAMIYHRARSRVWTMNRKPSRAAKQGATSGLDQTLRVSNKRFTAGFEFVGPARPDDARLLGVI